MAYGEKPGGLEGLRNKLYGDGPGSLSVESLGDVWDDEARLGLRQSGVFDHEWGLIDEEGDDPTDSDLPEGDFAEGGGEGGEGMDGMEEVGGSADETAGAYADKAVRRAQMSAQYQKMNQSRGK